MFNYKCTISYLGYKFNGYAIQSNVLTVQGLIEDELSIIFQTKIKINSSGRTDKFVHALNQVINFHAPFKILPTQLLNIINKKLNKHNINFINIELVDNNFHARYSCINKTYLYIINTGKFNLLKNDFELQYNKSINIKKLKKVSKIFLGTKNFLSFSTSELKDTIRTLNWIKIKKQKNKILIYLNGNGFLRNMVRMIVAQLLLINENKTTFENINNLFTNPKKGSGIDKSPGCGLYLYKVKY